MRFNLTKRTSLVLGCAVAVLALGGTTAFVLHGRTVAAGAAPVQVATKAEQHVPIHIRIPALKVSATVESVGLTSDGAVDAPRVPADAAWFNKGPVPGQVGNAVIDGHFGWSKGIPAVFDSLHLIKPGDTIYVQDDTKTERTFIVRATRLYHEKDDATAVFVSTDGKAHLVLITCGGIWNKQSKSYSDRLVVFADAI